MELSVCLFVSTAVASTLMNKYKNATKEIKPQGINTQRNAKGSFLLKTPQQESAAAKAAKALVDSAAKSTENQNEVVGRELIKLRDQQLGPNVSVFYKQDGGLVITSGKGAHMRDVDGNLHLDCVNNVACVGHAHPAVVEAGQKELANIQTNGRFLNPIQQRYVSKLLATFPPELNTVYFVNSGSEANDLALRIARAHTKATRPKDVIILDSAYHGHTQTIVDISPYKWYQAVDGKNYQPPTTHVVSCPDGYRGRYRLGQTEECGRLYAQEVIDIVESEYGGVGTFIAESIISCGGQVVPPPGFLQRCYAAVRKHGGVCIADEVQTGFARTGTHFWMFQRHGVVPDIVTFGKPMGKFSLSAFYVSN
jgi:ethanolamine-phosphate phospho-lyase